MILVLKVIIVHTNKYTKNKLYNGLISMRKEKYLNYDLIYCKIENLSMFDVKEY